MNNDAFQGMLFGTTSTDDEITEDGPAEELRLCALNVVEPNHQPRLPAFEEHDYAFYTGLLTLGLRDAYRELNPTGGDHSWINPRFGSQRLDHTLVSVAAGEIQTCVYDHTTRADKLSDHAALLTTIGLRPNRSLATC
ncbi:MAG: hypothetical protein WCF33_13765 [Pseudonocardiaceae bacterium]